MTKSTAISIIWNWEANNMKDAFDEVDAMIDEFCDSLKSNKAYLKHKKRAN